MIEFFSVEFKLVRFSTWKVFVGATGVIISASRPCLIRTFPGPLPKAGEFPALSAATAFRCHVFLSL